MPPFPPSSLAFAPLLADLTFSPLCRAILESFYGKGSAADLAKLLEKQQALDDTARRAAYAAEDLSMLRNKEVIDLLRHRDEAMKLNAAEQLTKRLKKVSGPELQKLKAYLIDEGLREIVDTLACQNYKLQETSINLVFDLSESDQDVIDVKLRATGGLEYIARLVVSPKKEIRNQALFLMVNLSHGDNNRDAFRRMTGVIESIVPGLDSSDEFVQRTTLKICVNLAVAPKLQDPIAQAGGMFKALQMMKMVKVDRAITIECLKLLQNLSACCTPEIALFFALCSVISRCSYGEDYRSQGDYVGSGSLSAAQNAVHNAVE